MATASTVYDEAMIAALLFCWAVMGAPAGKRMPPFLPEAVERLRAVGELVIDEATAAALGDLGGHHRPKAGR